MVSVNILNTSTNPDPEYKHDNDAGFDLYSNEGVCIGPRDSILVDVGLRVDIPVGYEGQIRLRSSYAKLGIIIPNAPGTIDSGYKGPIMVAVRNLKNSKKSGWLTSRIDIKAVRRFLPALTCSPISLIIFITDIEPGADHLIF